MSGQEAWKRTASFLFVAFAAGFLARAVIRDWRRVQDFSWQLEPLLLSVSVALLLVVLGWGVWVWGRVLRLFGQQVPFPVLARVFFLSSLARYLPGKVWQFVAAARMSGEAGLSGTLLLTSLAVQMGFVLLGASVVAVLALPSSSLGLEGTLWPARIAALLVILLLAHPRWLNLGLSLVRRLARREPLEWRGGWGDGLWLVALFTVNWVAYGLAFALFVNSLTPVSADTIFPLAGVNALAFVAGYLVIVAPAGLGVREASMAVLLAPYLPGGVAALVAVLSRLWSVLAEILGAAAALLFAPSVARGRVNR
ncbi:MAG: lysylphosphatidylglycerol synthase domain-containing protein [Longimicrobiaceae bacterium]